MVRSPAALGHLGGAAAGTRAGAPLYGVPWRARGRPGEDRRPTAWALRTGPLRNPGFGQRRAHRSEDGGGQRLARARPWLLAAQDASHFLRVEAALQGVVGADPSLIH